MRNYLVTMLSFSGLFMIIGGLFCLHAYLTYDKARYLIESLTRLNELDKENDSYGGTDTD